MPTCRETTTIWLITAVALAAIINLLTTGGYSDDSVGPAKLAAGAESSTIDEDPLMSEDNLSLATFGNGCFWCTEAVFAEVEGVESAVSGYSGGRIEKPTYRAVCSGTTGHAEVLHVKYDPDKVSYGELLEIFFKTHDPTTLNRQGNDVGTQYRSVIFYHDDQQRQLAEEYKHQLDASGVFSNPIVTEITEFDKFYPAEDYHQDYFEHHGHEPYCRLIIRPKVDKFRAAFEDKLKRAPAP